MITRLNLALDGGALWQNDELEDHVRGRMWDVNIVLSCLFEHKLCRKKKYWMLLVFTVMYTVSLYKCEFTRIHKVGLMQLLSQTKNNKLNKIAALCLYNVFVFCGRDACLHLWWTSFLHFVKHWRITVLCFVSGHYEVLFLEEFLWNFRLISEIWSHWYFSSAQTLQLIWPVVLTSEQTSLRIWGIRNTVDTTNVLFPLWCSVLGQWANTFTLDPTFCNVSELSPLYFKLWIFLLYLLYFFIRLVICP